ncbi:MAG: oxidoreductase [Flammeovirgaceae bacterium]|nr:oxidoreductase [Flammeovirgaceae bacterium]MBE62349.1 oxidoreductase [Flammeovirgaceae bacterium]HCX21212.1 oxidoreductase [Cytophagales bacterium]|tara:strand:+ start:9918 stop:11543 length:1626 start_codon:yes stop_codon:yes gene_type:complete
MAEEFNENKWSRRSILKGLAGVPFAGGILLAAASEGLGSQKERDAILNSLNIQAERPPATGPMSGDPIRVGIIGYGGRGTHLCRVLGFADKDWLIEMEKNAAKNPNDTRLKDFMEQENLNVKLTAICDVFDVRAELALNSFNTDNNSIKRYRTHQELIDSGEVDAVVIATPDHWHAPISIYALNAGVHVYVEKPMTHNIKETYELRDAALNSSAVFAVGHQHRQTQSFLTAQSAVKEHVLGHVSLVQANTNRNDDNGAWQYDIHELASPKTIDWQQFLGNAPDEPFNTEHFFRWRKWWAYGSGLSGDLMTHDYDRINCVLNMGIPKSVTASGGIYTHRDGRNVPDVMQINMEFPDFSTGSSQIEGKEKGMTLVYSATLGNQFNRGTLLMGHDATMELGNRITIYADGRSTRYQDMLQSRQMDVATPIYQYDPAAEGVDGITSATSKYFADKGLLWTYRDGKRVDSTYLHLREWLSCIRNGGTPSCGIQEGFEEAITAHMGGLSYKLGRRIEWDKASQEIVPIDGIDFDEVLLQNTEIYQNV